MGKEDQKGRGFSSEKERVFLGRLDPENRKGTLELELTTQLTEDLGLVKFSRQFGLKEGKIVDLVSGGSVVELTERGGVEEETESIRKIEEGLKKNKKESWIHFSPRNEILGYPENCVDFWRWVDNRVIWNRIVVKDGLERMKEVRKNLGDDKEVRDEMDILRLPIAVDLKLKEMFSFFTLAEKKCDYDYEVINGVVKKYLSKFTDEFGRNLTEDSELILRLYSLCSDRLRGGEFDFSEVVSRNDYRDLERYMYGIMNGLKTEKSFGCSGSTQVATFGEGYGYYIVDGHVSFGKVPEGFRFCKKCGCYYEGDKCPLCG